MTAVYKLPASLNVSAGCFGKSIRVRIGNRDGKAFLPSLEWSGDTPSVKSPTMPPAIRERVEHRIAATQEGWERVQYWGGVSGWHPGRRTISSAHISAVVMEFKVPVEDITYSEYLYGRGHPQGAIIQALFSEIDPWFERVRTWVEAAVDQDADPDNPIITATSPGQGLMVMTEDNGVISLPASSFTIIANLVQYEALKLPLLRRIVNQANSGAMPSDVHLLIKDSRAALRRNHFRRAVIDAGSAVELALVDFNSRVTHVSPASGRLPTLGWYVNRPAIARGAGVPANTTTDLVQVRNNAIHQNRVPSRDETVLALDLAKGIVNQVDPLIL